MKAAGAQEGHMPAFCLKTTSVTLAVSTVTMFAVNNKNRSNNDLGGRHGSLGQDFSSTGGTLRIEIKCISIKMVTSGDGK